METEFFYHTKNRLRERHGLDITAEEYDTLCRDLMKLKIPIHASKPAGGGRSELTIDFKGTQIRIIWQKDVRQIVTVLPREGSDEY